MYSEPVILSEDQWDIHKLDPAYDCFVAPFPQPPVICWKDPHEIPVHTQSSTSTPSGAFKKHRLSPLSDIDDQPPGLNKRFRTVVSLVTDEEGTEVEPITDSDEEDEVEDIVVEGSPKQNPKRADRREQRRREREERTHERREKLKAKMSSSTQPARPSTPEIVDLTMEENTPPDLSSDGAGPYATKRKGTHTLAVHMLYALTRCVLLRSRVTGTNFLQRCTRVQAQQACANTNNTNLSRSVQ